MPGHKWERHRNRQTSHTCSSPLKKLSPKKYAITMPADLEPPLFKISDGDKIKYEDDPAIAQAKANLAAVEQIQQERAEQRRLEREEWKVPVEVETEVGDRGYREGVEGT